MTAESGAPSAPAPGVMRVVRVSPHRSEGESIPLIMWTVVLALLPAFAVGLYVFGWRAAYVTVLSAASCVGWEALIQKLRGVRVTVADGSAVVSGVLLAFVLPASVSWYVPVVGAFVAMGIAKQAFGGLGANFFNPALVARVFLQFAFPSQVNMPEWPIVAPQVTGLARLAKSVAPGSPDAVTSATPLAVLKANPGAAWEAIPGSQPFGPPLAWLLPAGAAWAVFALLVAFAAAGIYLEATRGKRLAAVAGVGALLLFGVVPTGDISFGLVPGCIGETSAWALLLGGLALVYYRCINWRLPLAYIVTVAVLASVLPTRAGDGSLVVGFSFERTLVHVFGGGLFLGAFFMITDMVTSPLTSKGQVAFGVIAGVMAALIRLYAGYPEGVCYSILLANATRPLVDRLTMPTVFGSRRRAAPARPAG